MRRRGLGLLLFLFVSGAAVRGEEYRLPPQSEWGRLYGKAEIIKTEVSREIEADKSRWIEAYADLHTCTDIPLSSLRETILDYESYPRIFKRNKGMQVIRENGKVYHDMVAGIEVFGVTYTLRFRQLVTVLADEPGRLLVDYSYDWGDGRVKDVRGAWYFEDLPGTERCYVRYFAASRMMQRFPLQRFIMSMLIDGETRDALTQFLAAARERSAATR
ncbi:MAG: SRPBCC family protein [Treponema sp.]|jgi:ribosome-associated toxin RatA of RatAB toxin-antitoxin module|nr:SRPBCC family protein [Treponema sp.]